MASNKLDIDSDDGDVQRSKGSGVEIMADSDWDIRGLIRELCGHEGSNLRMDMPVRIRVSIDKDHKPYDIITAQTFSIMDDGNGGIELFGIERVMTE